jgi:hypothetical protein
MAESVAERAAAEREGARLLDVAREAAAAARSSAGEHAAAVAALCKSERDLKMALAMVQPQIEVERQASLAREELLRESARAEGARAQKLASELRSAQRRAKEAEVNIATLKAAAATSAWIAPSPAATTAGAPPLSPNRGVAAVAGAVVPRLDGDGGEAAAAGSVTVPRAHVQAHRSKWKQLLAKQQALVLGSSVRGVNGLYLATASVELPLANGARRAARRPVAFEKRRAAASTMAAWSNALVGANEDVPHTDTGAGVGSRDVVDDEVEVVDDDADDDSDTFVLRCVHRQYAAAGGVDGGGGDGGVGVDAARWQLAKSNAHGDSSVLFKSGWLTTELAGWEGGARGRGRTMVPTIPVTSWSAADSWLAAAHARPPEVFTVHPVFTVAFAAGASHSNARAQANAKAHGGKGGELSKGKTVMLVVGCTVPGASSTALPHVCSWFHAAGGSHSEARQFQAAFGAIRLEAIAEGGQFALCIDSIALKCPLALDAVSRVLRTAPAPEPSRRGSHARPSSSTTASSVLHRRAERAPGCAGHAAERHD